MTVVPVDQGGTQARDRVEQITARARAIRPGRTVLTVIAAVLYGIGWVAAKVFGVVWLAATWCAAAVQIGWEEARTPPGPSPSDGGGS